MNKQYLDVILQGCYKMGYDSIITGANVINSAFSLFSSAEKTKAWIKGRDDALNAIGETEKKK